jgi:hypothetical protein
VAPESAIGSAVRRPEGKGSNPARSTRSVTLPEAGEPSGFRGALTVNSYLPPEPETATDDTGAPSTF